MLKDLRTILINLKTLFIMQMKAFIKTIKTNKFSTFLTTVVIFQTLMLLIIFDVVDSGRSNGYSEFYALGYKVNTLDDRLNRIERTVDDTESTVDSIESRVENTERYVDSIVRTVDGIESTVDGIESTVDGMEIAIRFIRFR